MLFMVEKKNRNEIQKRFLIFFCVKFKCIDYYSFYIDYGFYYRQSILFIIVNISSEQIWLFIDIIE